MTRLSYRKRKRLMGEINVVPYIDVMLVLLVIFMVTAPLLTEGVHVDLVQAAAKTLPPKDQEPFVVTVDKDGRYFLNEGTEPVSAEDMQVRAAAVYRRHEGKIDFLVRGDRQTVYEHIIQAMVNLQQAGVASVGLVTEPTEP